MNLYVFSSNDPYFNLATEEWLLTNTQEETMLLWRNRPTVVYGCNQNLLREIDLPYLEEHDIRFVRRISGGGAVYHDLGNVNFSLLSAYQEGSFCDFSRFCAPVISYLKTLHIDAQMNGRNDITIDGAKFSGNAQAVRKDRLLHHGTLLFDTDLTVLSKALLPDPEKLSGKGVESIRSRVTNIRPHLAADQTADDFFAGLSSYFQAQPGFSLCTLLPEQIEAIQTLAQQKYHSFEWLYGKSPDYTFENHKRFASGSVWLYLKTQNAVITEISFHGDFFGIRSTQELCQHLVGVRHTPEDLKNILSSLPIGDYFSGIGTEEILTLFF